MFAEYLILKVTWKGGTIIIAISQVKNLGLREMIVAEPCGNLEDTHLTPGFFHR